MTACDKCGDIWPTEMKVLRSFQRSCFYQAFSFTQECVWVSDEELLRSWGHKENLFAWHEGGWWSFLLLHMTWESETSNCREERPEIRRWSFKYFYRSWPKLPPSLSLLRFRDPFILTISPLNPMKDLDEQQRQSSKEPGLRHDSSSQSNAVCASAATWITTNHVVIFSPSLTVFLQQEAWFCAKTNSDTLQLAIVNLDT